MSLLRKMGFCIVVKLVPRVASACAGVWLIHRRIDGIQRHSTARERDFG
jgi:hypothetical protein